MATKGTKNTPTPENMPIIPPHAAGIDVGAEEHWVCVPADREAQPIQTCRAFPCDLPRLANWRKAGGLTPVAMESTGGYGRPRLQRLETRGCAVAWVNARHLKHVPGRPTTERFACRWLHKLQSDGVLAPAFRPPEDVCRLRRLRRHRDTLGHLSGKHIQHRQQAWDHRHLHRHHVLSEVTGVTGMRILRAMVAGKRDPRTFATCRDYRMQSSEDPMAQALAGDDRPDHLFPLTPSLALYDGTPQQIAAGAQAMARVLDTLASLMDPATHPLPPPTTAHRHPQKTAPACALRTPRSRIPGVDLTPGPG